MLIELINKSSFIPAALLLSPTTQLLLLEGGAALNFLTGKWGISLGRRKKTKRGEMKYILGLI